MKEIKHYNKGMKVLMVAGNVNTFMLLPMFMLKLCHVESARQKKLLQMLMRKCVHRTIHGQLGRQLLLECVLFQRGSSYC